MASEIYVDLKLNRNLINSNFGGYKLSLDALPTYRTTVTTNLDVVKLSDDLYSYQHLKAFGIYNHIYLDPWNDNSVYFIDEKWNVMKAVMQGLAFISPTEQYSIPDAANRRLIPDRLNVSLSFTSATMLVLADGTGRLYILLTGSRNEDSEWKIGYSGHPLGGESGNFMVLNSVFRTCDSSCYVEVLCICIEKNPMASTDDTVPSFITKIQWLTFNSDNASTYNLIRTRRLDGFTSPEYAAILPNGSGVVLITEKPFKFTYDSVRPVTEPTANSSTIDEEEKIEPAYTWTQTNQDITVSIKLPTEVAKLDVISELKSDRLNLVLKDGYVLLNGDLFDLIDVDASTWIINDDQELELHLTKSEAGPWSILIIGDSRGKLVLSPEQIAEMNEQLDRFTSATENADPLESKKPAFNAQQLEECDLYPEDSSAIWCFDGDNHNLVQRVNISSNQWLFNALISAECLPAVCLRHDVDGVMWQPVLSSETNNTPAWQHIGTFDAFGYVQASKQQRKFATSSPAMSFVAIGDCVRHVYIYRRPTSIASPLRNRFTGETVSAVAKQQLVSLESTEDIMGFRANNTDIFVMSGKTLYALRVNDWMGE